MKNPVIPADLDGWFDQALAALADDNATPTYEAVLARLPAAAQAAVAANPALADALRDRLWLAEQIRDSRPRASSRLADRVLAVLSKEPEVAIDGAPRQSPAAARPRRGLGWVAVLAAALAVLIAVLIRPTSLEPWPAPAVTTAASSPTGPAANPSHPSPALAATGPELSETIELAQLPALSRDSLRALVAQVRADLGEPAELIAAEPTIMQDVPTAVDLAGTLRQATGTLYSAGQEVKASLDPLTGPATQAWSWIWADTEETAVP